MTETTQEERDQWRNSPAEMVRRLTHDADRLAKLEDGVRGLADEYGNASAEMTALGDHETAELWSETHNRLRAPLDEDGDN